jgi:hypothetical protein
LNTREFRVPLVMGVPHPRAADRDVADADLVELSLVQRVIGEDLLLLPPLAGRDPDAADDAVLVVGHRALDGRRVVDGVIRHRAVLSDRGAAGRLARRRRDLLEVDQVDDVERGRVGRVALQPEPGAGRVGLGQQCV